MFSAIVFLPLLGSLIAGFLGRYIGARGAQLVTCTFLVISCVLSWVAFFQVGFGHETAKVPVFTFIDSGALQAAWALRIDTLTAVMLIVVTTVSSVVHIYSIGYMSHDPHQPRFFAYLSFFTFAMLMLVTSDNFVQLFFGWEGVGLASYLLIGFWFKKPSANAAAMKAFVVNRVGDFGLILGIAAIFLVFGSVEYDAVFASAGDVAEDTFTFLGYEVPIITTVCLLLFMGAMGKSAQFLLHTWLPDAMEGPTPVSALIHAATMVTAGVFLVARMSPLFEYSEFALATVTFFGAFTAFFAATIGIAQNDIKRVVAYSTCSQLGYMFVAMGVGAYEVGMFHLTTHAFFKALLFLGSGSVIHAMHEEQDMRKMGGLFRMIPITYAMMLIGSLALSGFWFTAGYYSKDAIIEAAFAATHNPMHAFGYLMTVLAAFLTAFYSARLIFMTFHGTPRASNEVMSKVHESPLVMILPMGVLAIGALFAGMVFYPYFIGHDEAHFWGAAIFNGADNHILEEMHHVPFWVIQSPAVMMMLGFIVAWYFYIRHPETPRAMGRNPGYLHKFLINKWYIDELYDAIFVKPALWIGRLFWKQGDGRIIDGMGPNGVAARVVDISRGIAWLQTGYLYHYAFAMLLGIAALATYFMLRGGA